MTTDAMLEAHVQYELKRLNRRNLKRTIREEIGSALDWLEEVKLGDIASAAQVMESIQRNAIDRPLSAEMVDDIEETVREVYHFLNEDSTRVEEILPRELFDGIVGVIIGLKALRGRIAHQVVASSVYSRLISDVLYHGIKDFLLTQNALAKNIPGASSLVRLGRKSLSAASPKLGADIDKQLVKFINANIQDTIAESETFLDKALDAPTMRQLGDEIWNANAHQTMAELSGYVDPTSLKGIMVLVRRFWLHYRQTPFFHAVVEQVVEGFFERYGDRDIRSLLDDMGVTQEVIIQEGYAFAIPVIEKGLASGYIERRIRKRLGAFYEQYQTETGER